MAQGREEREQLIERYARGPALVQAALAKAPAEALQWRPEPKRWSVHEVIVHCADSETNSALRLRYLLAEPEPLIVGYDQDRWASAFDYHSEPIADALAAMTLARSRTVPLLRRMDEAAWARVGRHTESGRYGAEDWLRIYAAHLEGHARQIERNLEAWKQKSSSR